ncbi:MAG: cytochrome c [Chitinophagaceae bacterium]|nr:cytochrome c [Chitinophagaceae bacterium]MBK9486346.1 cytochrome c [Chitinophagaceae bacterium]MBL0202287.1 cytochrome c [Chitinophagaceae bacterium]
MKKFAILLFMGACIAACGGNAEKSSGTSESSSSESGKTENGNPSYDPERGEGKFTEVAVGEKLDPIMAAAGEKVYGVKCVSCHKLTGEKLVGPGWLGVTDRHTAAWIMNFATNTDAMLNKDPKAQAQLEICLVRMPNQNIADEDARALYEFMRRNDGIK